MPIENHESSDSAGTDSEVRGEHAADAPIVPRVKVDVEKLRQNMNSFRNVSTQSVEKALVTHALRTERLSINGRIFLVCVMGFMSIFLAIANYKGIINYPALIWVTMIAAIAAGLELTRKMYAIKSRGKALVRCEESCAGKNAPTPKSEAADKSDPVTELNSTSPVPPPLPATQLTVSDDEADRQGTAATSTSPYAAIVAVTANEELAPVTAGLLTSQNAGRQEKDEYFEL